MNPRGVKRVWLEPRKTGHVYPSELSANATVVGSTKYRKPSNMERMHLKYAHRELRQTGREVDMS